jgi:hypothetical protein
MVLGKKIGHRTEGNTTEELTRLSVQTSKAFEKERCVSFVLSCFDLFFLFFSMSLLFNCSNTRTMCAPLGVAAGDSIARMGSLEKTSSIFCMEIVEWTMRLTSICCKICHSLVAIRCFLPPSARATWPKFCEYNNFQPHRKARRLFGSLRGSADMMHPGGFNWTGLSSTNLDPRNILTSGTLTNGFESLH